MGMIREDAIKTLLYLGVSMANRGFVYICDCMELIEKDKRFMTDTYELYKEIANVRRVKMVSVEALIRYEITNICAKCNPDILVEVFGNYEKLTNSNALARLYQYLSTKGKSNGNQV